MRSVLLTCLLTTTLITSTLQAPDEAKRTPTGDDKKNPSYDEADLNKALSSVEVPTKMEDWTPQSLVNPEEIGSNFEGDIELPLPILPRNGLINKKYHWPDGKVPYVIGDEFPPYEKLMILGAMAKLSNDSDRCITFHKRNNEKDYIHFQQDKKKGCQSSVGKRGGKQIVNYHPLCLKVFGTLMHEMLHFLGFYHEQSRYDRDDFIRILWENISVDRHHNFKPYSASTISGYGEGYDYNSIMHYSAYAFSKSGKKTILPKDPKAKIGQRIKLSKTDIAKLKKMYEC